MENNIYILKIKKIGNFQYIIYSKNCFRQKFKKLSRYLQDNMSGNLNQEFEPCSLKTVGGDRFWILQGMVLRQQPLKPGLYHQFDQATQH